MTVQRSLAILMIGTAALLPAHARAQDAPAVSVEILERLLAEGAQEALAERLGAWSASTPLPRLGRSVAAADPIASWLAARAARLAVLDRAPPWMPLLLAARLRSTDIVDRMTWVFLWRIRKAYESERCIGGDLGFSGYDELIAADVSMRIDFGGQQVVDAIDRALAIDQADPYRGPNPPTCHPPRTSLVGRDVSIAPESEWPRLYEQARVELRDQRDAAGRAIGAVVAEAGLMIEHAVGQPQALHRRHTLQHDAPVRSLAWSREGSLATATVAAERRTAIAVWTMASGTRASEWSAAVPAGGDAAPAVFVREGAAIAAVEAEGAMPAGRAAIRDVQDGALVGRLDWPADFAGSPVVVTDLRGTSDGRFLAVEYVRNNRCGTLIYDASTLAVHADIRNESGTGAWGLRFTSEGRMFALFHPSGSAFGISAGHVGPFSIAETQLRNTEVVAPLAGHRLAYDGSRQMVALSLVSGLVDLTAHAPVVDPRPACLIEADDPWVVHFVDWVSSIRILGLQRRVGGLNIRVPSTASSLEWSRDGRFLAAVFHDRWAEIWDFLPVQLGARPGVTFRGRRLEPGESSPPRPAYHGDGPHLVPVVGPQPSIGVARIRSETPRMAPTCAQFSPDARMIAICNGTDVVVLDLP